MSTSVGMPAINFASGLSLGYGFVGVKNKEEEVKQGGNYYLAVFQQSGALVFVGTMMGRVVECITPDLSLPVSLLLNFGGFVYVPFGLFCAAVRRGDYEYLALKAEQEGYFFSGAIPRNLSETAVSILGFFPQHMGDIASVGVVVCVVASVYFGHCIYAGALLAAIVYRELDARGYVPREISLFMEIYMPFVSSIGYLFSGSPVLQIMSVVRIISYFSTPFYWIQQQIDQGMHLAGLIEGPSLAEYEAPLIEQQNLTYEQMTQILEADADDFEINPAHCSKWAIQFPENHQFNRLLELYDEIDWSSKHEVIRLKLQDDDQFLLFLKEQFPDREVVKPQDDDRFLLFLRERFPSEEDVKGHFEELVDQLAREKGITPAAYLMNWNREAANRHFDELVAELAEEENITPAAYLMNWNREHMHQLVQVLQGEVRPKGLQQDLDAAISDCAKVISFLENPTLSEQCKEDVLLKLAVEAGDYCARGIKRAASEIVWETVVTSVQSSAEDDNEDYPMKIRAALQNERHRIIQETYRKLAQDGYIPTEVAQDVHGFDLYRMFLSLGFHPVTELERYQLSISEFIIWEILGLDSVGMRATMLESYRDQMEAVVMDQGELHLATYIRASIAHLSQQDQDRLLARYNDESSEVERKAESRKSTSIAPLTPQTREQLRAQHEKELRKVEETNRSFARLMLVMLGVLRLRASS